MKKKINITLTSLLFISAFNPQAFAENLRNKGVIKKVKNQVEFKNEVSPWEKLLVNQVIFPVTSIKTGVNSKVEIMFSDGSITRVGSKSFFTLLNKQNRAIKVQMGKVWFNVKKKSHGLKIYSPNAIASITGTEGFVEFEGNVEQENNIYIVKEGDNLSDISRKLLGNNPTEIEINTYIKELVSLNTELIKNKNLVYTGEKLVTQKTTKINLAKSDAYFALGLIEGSSNVSKSGKNGEEIGKVQKVKEGELLTLKGNNFVIKDLDSAFPKGMVPVKGGSFQMGGDGENDEKPIHKVDINTFLIGKYEVTQADYKTLMGKNPSNFVGEKLPVENVSWWDAIKYCNKKSLQEKLPVAYNEKTGELLDINGKPTKDITEVVGYRLLTEAEWEYTAKGGYKSANYKYSGSNSIDAVAWYGYGLADKTTHQVGSKKPNEIGIFDMTGNVSEWTYDTYISDAYKKTKSNNPYFSSTNLDDYRSYRGGSWDSIEKNQYVFNRSGYLPEYKSNNIGFRIAKNLSF